MNTVGMGDNYIILDPRGNTYFGSVATRVATSPKRDQLDRFSKSNQFFVVEDTGDELVCRASQSSLKNCRRYMAPGRILVWHSGLMHVIDTRQLQGPWPELTARETRCSSSY